MHMLHARLSPLPLFFSVDFRALACKVACEYTRILHRQNLLIPITPAARKASSYTRAGFRQYCMPDAWRLGGNKVTCKILGSTTVQDIVCFCRVKVGLNVRVRQQHVKFVSSHQHTRIMIRELPSIQIMGFLVSTTAARRTRASCSPRRPFVLWTDVD